MNPALLLNQAVSPHAVDFPSGMSTQGCSANSLKFICEFKPGPGPPKASGDEDYNVNMDCESVSVILPAQCSVYQLRLRICMQVGKPLLDGLLFKFCYLFCFLSESFKHFFQYIHIHSSAHCN